MVVLITMRIVLRCTMEYVDEYHLFYFIFIQKTEIFHQLVHSPHAYIIASGWSRPKPRAQNSTQIFPVGSKEEPLSAVSYAHIKRKTIENGELELQLGTAV